MLRIVKYKLKETHVIVDLDGEEESREMEVTKGDCVVTVDEWNEIKNSNLNGFEVIKDVEYRKREINVE